MSFMTGVYVIAAAILCTLGSLLFVMRLTEQAQRENKHRRIGVPADPQGSRGRGGGYLGLGGQGGWDGARAPGRTRGEAVGTSVKRQQVRLPEVTIPEVMAPIIERALGSKPQSVSALQAENARLVALLEQHDIAWRAPPVPDSPPAPVSAPVPAHQAAPPSAEPQAPGLATARRWRCFAGCSVAAAMPIRYAGRARLQTSPSSRSKVLRCNRATMNSRHCRHTAASVPIRHGWMTIATSRLTDTWRWLNSTRSRLCRPRMLA